MATDVNTLPVLKLKPFRSGYAVNLGDDFITTPVEAGPVRQRRDFVGRRHNVSATYKHKPEHHQYFMAFRRAYAGREFLAYLLVDDTAHHWYRCKFVTAKNVQPQYGGGMFTVATDLQVEPLAYDYKDGQFVAVPTSMDSDLSIVAIYNMTDGNSSLFFNELEQLVNYDLPDATAGL